MYENKLLLKQNWNKLSYWSGRDNENNQRQSEETQNMTIKKRQHAIQNDNEKKNRKWENIHRVTFVDKISTIYSLNC